MNRKLLLSIPTIVLLASTVSFAQEEPPPLPPPPSDGFVTEKPLPPDDALRLQPLAGSATTAAMGTAFTYQGQLRKSGAPVTGSCNFRFSLFDALSGGAQIGATQTRSGVSVSNGLFTIPDLDFGSGAFNGEARWLAIAVQCPPDSSYTALSPRQALTPAPYALALPGLWTQQNGTSPNLIGGYHGNQVTAGAVGATIGGGGAGGSFNNRVTDDYGTVGGGSNNQAGDNAGTTSDRSYATVGGGYSNTASGGWSTVGGGDRNTASGKDATVGGGWLNTASGDWSTVGGGRQNTAAGDYSFVVGRRATNANAAHDGVFLFADSSNFDFASTAANQFRVRATGGVTFVLAIDAGGNPTWTCSVVNGGSWACSSDRNLKENLAHVDGTKVLAQLSSVPIYTWSAKGGDPAVRHIGPMAQDFYAAFGLGNDDKTISTIDLDGVALAAIQGLYQENTALKAENAALKAEVVALGARLAAIEQVLRAQGEAKPWAGAPVARRQP